MKVKDIVGKLGFEVVAGEAGLDKEVESGYCGDLLSWVMAKAEENSIWVTIQSHVNIVAVATLLNISCIVVAEGSKVHQDSIDKANEEEIPILTTKLNSFTVVKELLELGIE